MMTATKTAPRFSLTDEVKPENFHELRVSNLKKYVRRFFKSVGQGHIPDDVLFTEANLDRMFDTDFMKGLLKLHKAIAKPYTKQERLAMDKNGKVEPEIELVRGLLHKCALAGVPKQYAVGVLTVYVETCLEVAIPA